MHASTLESGIRRSIDQYSQILVVLHNIEEEIGTASHKALQEMNTLLTAMQTQAAEIDRLIMTPLPKKMTVPPNILDLMAERARLINDVLLLNRNVTIKAMGVKSLLAHEMGILRNGKSALSGYRPHQYKQGRIVNSSL